MGEFMPRPKTLRGESNLETPAETQADGAPLFRISDLSAAPHKKKGGHLFIFAAAAAKCF